VSTWEEPDRRAGALHREAERLATSGQWSTLLERLEAAGLDTVLQDSSLAYRYGEALYHTGRIEDLSAFALRFEESTAPRADGRGLLRALNLGAIAAFELGRIEEARSRSERQLTLADAEDDRDMLARATQNLAAIAGLEGRTEDAVASFELALSTHATLGRVRGVAQVRHNLGNCFRDLGRYDDAQDAYRDAEADFRRLDYPRGVAMATIGRAEATVLAGDTELGVGLAERGVSAARSAGDPGHEAEALRVRARAALATGDREMRSAAARDLAAALRLARSAGNPLIQAEIERDAGRLRIEAGRRRRARGPLRRALARFEKLGAVAEARKLRERLESLV